MSYISYSRHSFIHRGNITYELNVTTGYLWTIIEIILIPTTNKGQNKI